LQWNQKRRRNIVKRKKDYLDELLEWLPNLEGGGGESMFAGLASSEILVESLSDQPK